MMGRVGALVLLLAAACTTSPDVPSEAAGLLSEERGDASKDEGRRALTRQVLGPWTVRPGQPPEAAAREVLAQHAAARGLRADGADLTVAWIRQGLAGTYVRFDQRIDGLRLFGHGVTVLVADAGDHVRAMSFDHLPNLQLAPATQDIGKDAALAAARAALANPAERRAPILTHGAVADETAPGAARAVYRVTLDVPAPRAVWQVTVDAADGAIVRVRDILRRADGTAMVFDMSPVQSTGDTTLIDDNDRDSGLLGAARFAVPLTRLDGSGVLRGTWADVKNPSSRATSPTLEFAFTRDDDRFEEVNVYYHLDRAQAHIQSLGFTGARGVNDRVQVATVNDGNQDNSFYSPADKELSFGAGGVDDAEDGDIVLHEYGHSIQDNIVPDWGESDDANAMGEGFGDYLAAAFGDVLPTALGHAQPAQPGCVGDWDAVSYDTAMPPCLRRVDGTKHFPEASTGGPHADGEIWSGALWRARPMVGANIMDALVIESHFMLGPAASFDDSANALLMLDQMLHDGTHREALEEATYRNGILRTLKPPVFFSDAAIESVDVSNPVSGGTYVDNLDDTQTITRDGALALRVRFATIDTELDNACFDGACDNIYLYDRSGDLYQILNGSQAGVVSVQVPGDTIQIRLVTDGSVRRAGYRIDEVHAMSGAPLVDAAIDAPDLPGPDAGTGPGADDSDGGCCGTGRSAPGSAALALLTLAALLPRRRVRNPAACQGGDRFL